MLIYLLIINIISYSLMWIDKVKSVYRWWRVSEKTLWVCALLGGAGGIWLGMQAPLYHKAGKRDFRLGVPIITCVWLWIVIKYLL